MFAVFNSFINERFVQQETVIFCDYYRRFPIAAYNKTSNRFSADYDFLVHDRADGQNAIVTIRKSNSYINWFACSEWLGGCIMEFPDKTSYVLWIFTDIEYRWLIIKNIFLLTIYVAPGAVLYSPVFSDAIGIRWSKFNPVRNRSRHDHGVSTPKKKKSYPSLVLPKMSIIDKC